MAVYEVEVAVKLLTEGFKSGLKQLGNDSQQAGKDMDKDMTAWTVALGTKLADFATKAGQFFVSTAKKGLQYNADMQRYSTMLTTALGDEAAAYRVLEQVKRDAALTPYSVEGLIQANSYLISAGESAEGARNTVMGLTDAISAVGGGNEELARAALNLQQIKTQGKAATIDMKQFQQMSIPVWEMLADYTGKSVQEVKEMTITYDLLSGAFQHAAAEGGRFFEANIAQSRTLGGQFNTLQDNISQKLGEAFKGVADILTNTVLPAANRFVEGFDLAKVSAGIEDVAKGVAVLGAAIAAVSFVSWVTGVGNVSSAVAKLTPLIKDAVAAWQLLGETGYLSAFGGVTAILGVAAVATIDYANSIDAAVAEQRTFGETSTEVAARLAEVQAEYNNWKNAAENGATEYNVYETMTLLEQEITALKERYEELKTQEEGAAEGADALADSSETAAEGLDGLTESTDETVEALADIITNYNKLHENIAKNVNSWFGLFDEAKTKVKANVSDMMKNMQSQIDFNTTYSQNLQYLADNGLSDLGSAFQSMGADGAAYAQALVTAIEEAGGATSEGGQEVIANFEALAQGVESSKSDLTDTLTDMTGSLQDALADWGASAEQAAEALNQSGAAGSAAAATVNAYIAGIAAGAPRAGAAAAHVAQAAARAFAGGAVGGGGATPLAVGSDYIPYDNFPALLHKGEMVIPAKISEDLRDFLGAGQQPSSQGAPYTGGNGGGSISEVVGLLRDLIVATNRPVVLDSGRLVGGIGSAMNNELGDMDVLGRRGVSFA